MLRTCCQILLVHALAVAMAAAGVRVPSGECCCSRTSAGDDAAAAGEPGGCLRCRAAEDEDGSCSRCRRAEQSATRDVADRCGCRCPEETEAVATAQLPERRSQPQNLLPGTTAAVTLPPGPSPVASTPADCNAQPGGSPRPLWIVHCAVLT